MTLQRNGATVLTTSKSYYKLNRLGSVSSVVNSQPATGVGYGYNAANQRTRATLSDGSSWNYRYDALGQVIAGEKLWSDNTAVGGEQFGYSFDAIGNRVSSVLNGRRASYAPNALNQYSTREVPGVIDVLGKAQAGATVTVNREPVTRQAESFWKQLAVDNTAAPVEVVGVKSNTGSEGEDAVSTKEGHRFVAKTPEGHAPAQREWLMDVSTLVNVILARQAGQN